MSKVEELKLDKEILRAHDEGDSYKLAELYSEAARIKKHAGEMNAAGFLRTQAFVFALESAHPLEGELRKALVVDGRELSE
ncbi:MAG: hypothetical protein V3V02_01185 [Rhizobiaceae bacterium]